MSIEAIHQFKFSIEHLIKDIRYKESNELLNYNEIIEIENKLRTLQEYLTAYARKNNNSCLMKLAYELNNVICDHSLTALNEIKNNFNFMSDHNVERCHECIIKTKHGLNNGDLYL